MIESSPGQSQVYIDDEPVGSTSQQGRLKLTRLAAGDHRVRISLSGYQDHEETVTLTAGEVTTVAATLQQPAAPLEPTSLRPQAEETPTANPARPSRISWRPAHATTARGGARGGDLRRIARRPG